MRRASIVQMNLSTNHGDMVCASCKTPAKHTQKTAVWRQDGNDPSEC
jgi:hypothetical protein